MPCLIDRLGKLFADRVGGPIAEKSLAVAQKSNVATQPLYVPGLERFGKMCHAQNGHA